MALPGQPGYLHTMTTNKTGRGNAMKPSIRGKLLLGAIVALALSSYVAITANASKAVGAGIYEVEASELSYADLVAVGPTHGGHELQRLVTRSRR